MKTEINKAIESINIDFQNNVVTTVYFDKKPKDRYFTDGFTIAKNPKIIGDRIEMQSHVCLGMYHKGGYLPVNEFNMNWVKASKKQRNYFKSLSESQS